MRKMMIAALAALGIVSVAPAAEAQYYGGYRGYNHGYQQQYYRGQPRYYTQQRVVHHRQVVVHRAAPVVAPCPQVVTHRVVRPVRAAPCTQCAPRVVAAPICQTATCPTAQPVATAALGTPGGGYIAGAPTSAAECVKRGGTDTGRGCSGYR